MKYVSIQRFKFLLLSFFVATVILASCKQVTDDDKKEEVILEADKKNPNVVFILVDDLGWMDLQVQGSDYYLTPRVDELASNGVRFTNAYAANPVCSPTRASIMTGKDPAHQDVNISNWIGAQTYENRRNNKIIQPQIADELALDEVTLAEAFQDNGYSTYFVGKWHLGETEEYWPEAQGFDENVAGWSKGNPGSFFAPYNNPRIDDGPDGEYLPYRLGREVNSFIENHEKEKGDQPFLMYLSMYNVHTPIQAPEDLVAKFEKRRIDMGLPEKGTYETDTGVKNRTNQSDATYAAMVYAMDSVVGTVVDNLDALGIADDTAIVFFSDNGGLSSPGYGVTTNRPLRAGKGWLYEGGIREPLIVKYPAMTNGRKGTVDNTPVSSYDFYSTLLDLSRLESPKAHYTSGQSIVPLLKGESMPERSLYWHYPHYSPQGGRPGSAIRTGDWKLIHFYEDGTDELYNLKDDISEANNLAASQPDRVAAMKNDLIAHLHEIGALYPKSKENGTEITIQ